MSTYSNFSNELVSHDIDLHPSELHGLLVGYLCAVKDNSEKDRRAALYASWLDVEPPTLLADLLEEAFDHALENMGEYSDFDFKLLIPGDDSSIADRARAVALWCSGFLSGFGETGRHVDETTDAGEALRDMARIAAMTDEVPEGEDNESDLNEIVEFIRVSALLIFSGGEQQAGAH